MLDRPEYGDNKWLGTAGYRVESSEGEWPVSYHGTGVNVSGNIAQERYTSKGETPSVHVDLK